MRSGSLPTRVGLPLRVLGGLFALCASVQIATAQSDFYKIIVPFAPGGGQDVLARVIAPELSTLLGETVIVENRAGAGGGVGSSVVARSAPDGRTMVMAASSHSIGPAIDRKTAYDPIKDFTPLAHVGTGAYLLLINAAVPAKSVAELIAYAKANPGKLNYASAGVGSATHLASAYFTNRAEINVVHVPYKSTAEALNSTVVGDTQILIVPTLGSQGFIENPSLKVLAVVSKKRVPSLPNIPTVSESGLPDFEFTSWFGLLGPANIPADVRDKLNGMLNKVINMPGVAEKIEIQGIEPRTMNSSEFSQLLSDNYETIKRIVKAAGIGAT
ncbi:MULTISPECIES: tripartite tricarboxylate transporter substrate-binding protein [unclassified Beijerinckia]|uniref:Bug family tripartite tricarboxylate transporter substrate binding protein n=1 Tax=unclassified Beijerinckia TaxID=2638183 RepID=UPI00089AC332|nr:MULTISPECIES: tripartite tricarboxylate transporter substrate-binding protein [unclassified Beijerinckia]MDH7795135.1 tripartite-type tricarboxylate transporter receptor subunit TctC [Beijerinckia sp. GAS462]SEB89052.1 Tripartite-type tricarboxylate transporter, receptor component TctC [Beijerinckia sp. 28-YEA-48]